MRGPSHPLWYFSSNVYFPPQQERNFNWHNSPASLQRLRWSSDGTLCTAMRYGQHHHLARGAASWKTAQSWRRGRRGGREVGRRGDGEEERRKKWRRKTEEGRKEGGGGVQEKILESSPDIELRMNWVEMRKQWVINYPNWFSIQPEDTESP